MPFARRIELNGGDAEVFQDLRAEADLAPFGFAILRLRMFLGKPATARLADAHRALAQIDDHAAAFFRHAVQDGGDDLLLAEDVVDDGFQMKPDRNVDPVADVAIDDREVMHRVPRQRVGIGLGGPGDRLDTNKRRPILTFTEDTTPGIHDTVIAACDIWRYRGFGITTYHDSCTDNLRLAMRAIGVEAPEVPSPFNLFMNIPIGPDGSIAWLPPTSRAGDHVTFRAEMDLIYAVSCCPQDQIPINGEGQTPMEAHIVVEDAR